MKLSKIILLLLLSGSCIFNSCKKKEETPNNTSSTTTTTPTSSPDSIKIGTLKYAFTGKTCGVVSGNWRVIGNYSSSNSIWIYVGVAAAPSASTTFTLIAPTTPGLAPTLASNQAYIYCSNGATYESFSGGTLVVTISGGITKIGLNNVTLRIGSASGYAQVFNMQLTCP